VIFENGVKLVFEPKKSVRISGPSAFDSATMNAEAAKVECAPLTEDGGERDTANTVKFYRSETP
jgi:hypothetical protein